MHQTFSGSSRRPRQVNLSGQNANPFGASSWGSTASGPLKSVANAQHERQQRQQERDRLHATKKIQRTWRGHKTRRDLANYRRHMWDQMQNGDLRWSGASQAQELRLLLAFFSYRTAEDMQRLMGFCCRFLEAKNFNKVKENALRSQLLPLAKVVLEALAHGPVTFRDVLLRTLAEVIDDEPSVMFKVASVYYSTLSSVIKSETATYKEPSSLLTAIQTPLLQPLDRVNAPETMFKTYVAFATFLLTVPNLCERIQGMEDLLSGLDIEILSQAILLLATSSSVSALRSESRLWLLAHFITVHRFQKQNVREVSYLRALTVLLSACAAEMVGRIDIHEPQEEDVAVAEEDGDSEPRISAPLPQFVKNELISLVNKENITGLLLKFHAEYNDRIVSEVEDEASLLASYALMLLRIFPNLGEEIRMWLYQGSISVVGSDVQIPAVKLFWQAMKTTSTFVNIVNDSKSALNLLRASFEEKRTALTAHEDVIRHRDWCAILLFLELYSFVLRYTDDEEFLSGGELSPTESGVNTSRSRASALPLKDVMLLTIFLKNLSFTMYYNIAELSDHGSVSPAGPAGLGAYFGTAPAKSNFTNGPPMIATDDESKNPNVERPFLGIAGMTFEYVRGIVTRVMQMLYERDSRRKFLPKDHWLMTSRFDMEGFIPAVVIEEGRRHLITEDDGGQDDQEFYEADRERALVGMGASRRHRHLENLRRQQQKAARKNILAAVGPRLEVLQNMPFVIPFKTRVQIFRQFVHEDQLRRRDGTVDPDDWRMSIIHSQPGSRSAHLREMLGRHHAKIRRGHVFEDAFDQFYSLGEGLKEPIQITFVDQFDNVEAGIDGGGVTKEFLTSVTNEAFRNVDSVDKLSPNLFVANDQNLLYPNPAALDERRELLRQSGLQETDPLWRENIVDLLTRYEFLGRVVGKCMYEGILVDIGFAGFFLRKWASSDASGTPYQESKYSTNINDLRDLDESLYQGLLKLKDYAGDVTDFSLDFTITDTVSLPGEPLRTISRELLPGGANIPVTNENRVLYVPGVARHRLHVQPYQQTRAFLRGLGQLIKPSWLSMFNQAELQTLLGGDSSEIDVDDLRRNTVYSGIYVIGDDGMEHPTIQMFWKVMKELDDTDRRKVLKYVTSTPRAPLLGFGQLNPRFSIRDAGTDEQRLPSTSTCINLLKMPRYSSPSTLATKLLYAVNSGAGFDLS